MRKGPGSVYDKWNISVVIISPVNNMALVTCGAKTANPSGVPEFTPGYSGVRVVRCLVFCVMFCRSLFVHLYFFLSWPLCCLLFFDIRILITPLVSSNSSFGHCIVCHSSNHGYDIDNEAIWKSKVVKIYSCLQILKTRNLTFKGKILIYKSLIISLIGYEIELRGIPENYLNIINRLIWGFIWNNKVYQLDRNVCCMEIEEGELEMINLFTFVKSKQIKVLFKIMHSGNETWTHWANTG